MTTADALRETLCTTFCRDVAVVERPDGFAVALPMAARDGDHMTAYVSQKNGGWRVSDKGSTMMRLSYENDLAKLLTGARERLYQTVLQEAGLSEVEGELFLDVPADSLSRGLFSLGQGAARVEDLGLWTRSRVESTFYSDLLEIVRGAAGWDSVVENYEVPDVPNGDSYPVDLYVKTGSVPLYIFGVLNRDKARLTTIILQHLSKHTQNFNSMVVYSDVDDIPKADAKRLMNAANDSVASINDRQVIAGKIAHRLQAGPGGVPEAKQA